MMDWAHGTYCKLHTVFEWESLKARDHLGDVGVDQKTIRMVFQRYWINVCQERNKCRGFVNTVMNPWAP
jgi:hypothetical protein